MPRDRLAHATFRITLAYLSLTTVIWFYLLWTGEGGVYFGGQITAEDVGRLVGGFLVFWIGWSYGFYRLKRFLLRRIGLGEPAIEQVFSNRLSGFELDSLIEGHSERAIRIVDMVARRGRVAAVVFVGFYVVYRVIGDNPTPESLSRGLESSLLEGMVFAWWGIFTFYSNGILGRIHYGAQARVMDGVLGRANALCIGTLWHAFKFVMIPIGGRLAGAFSPEHYATVYALIWFSYLSCDFASEIFGSLFGKQSIRVWGLGDINRKSVAGTLGGFATGLAVCCLIVRANGCPPIWYALALTLAITSTIVELFSPRGTDDFTMATANALVCWAFGAVVIAG